jgi:hypothetical protein
MLTLKRRRKRRVPPQRGRGAISGLFFCFAQCSILTVGVSSGSAFLAGVIVARSGAVACCALLQRAMLVERW